MKRTLIASAVTAALIAAPASAAGTQQPTGAARPTQLAQAPAAQAKPGAGPGMMGRGHGPGYGHMGPGMMGQGYGPGYGHMGPGMMGQGYGPGYGHMGPGMMGQATGPGMMYGAGPYAALDLSAEQRTKIAEIQQGLWRKHWDLMGKMHEERYHMHELMSGTVLDDASARKGYQAMADAHKQMFEATLDARKRIDAVLTKEQRKKLRGGARGG